MTNRRDFLKTTAMTGAGIWVTGKSWSQGNAPSEKINFACIGCGGKGSSDVDEAAKQGNIVAMCDADFDRAKKKFAEFPNARKYRDFREMLEKEAKNIEAVTISTPDHIHAPAAVMAMKLGKHCFVQKPLTKALWEARELARVAKEQKVQTQMGNQGTSGDRLRRAVEIIQAGVLGPVKRLHAWTNRPIWPQGVERPKEEEPVPETLSWDLWLGPTSMRPYNHVYLPFNWRGWYDWGTGAFGDMACHTLNLPFWALELRNPTAVEAKVSKLMPESYPSGSSVDYWFPSRGSMPELQMTWSDGDMTPKGPEDIGMELPKGTKWSKSGIYIVGEKGGLYSWDDYGDKWALIGEVSDEGVPEKIERIHGKHFEDWTNAIRGGRPAGSNFADYASPLTETVLLGTVAQRLPGKRLEWDSANLKFTNAPEADPIVHPQYPEGWILK